MNLDPTILLQAIDSVPDYQIFGQVTSIKGLMVECSGLVEHLAIGSNCNIITRDQQIINTEVVGFRGQTALLMPFSELNGVGVGCKVLLTNQKFLIYPDSSWLGRVIDANAKPIDSKGRLVKGSTGYELKNKPPPAHTRNRVIDKLDLGVRAINSFLSCCYGQRMGIFAGSGVGKSMLLSMITKYADTDIKVIGLIGERGREVQEFLQVYLGEEGLAKAIVVVSTSDEAAIMRRQAAYLTMSIAEYFRDQGKNVLCIIDNVTRFAMAQREIGLSSGEPPSSKGYTPTVFSELPQLLERAGPGTRDASITGLFSVLVEGDDHNEPISDAVRGILDGHIVLDRDIANRGRYPAINILKSVSRTMPDCNTDEENELVNRARRLLSVYNDMGELIRIGAYKKGSDPEIDQAIFYHPRLEKFLSQAPKEYTSLAACYNELAELLAEKA
jgi:flagellum-specific ATP synthase